MGLFGKKKAPEKLLAEGRAQFESGDMRHMFLTLHGLANKGNPEACYYIGVYWLKEKSDKSMAKKYLTTAAKGGQTDAAKLLAEQLGVRDFLPQAPEPAPAAAPVSKPAPQPAPVSVSQTTEDEPSVDDLLEELEETGKLIQETKRELRQAEKKMGGVGEISRPKSRAAAEQPDVSQCETALDYAKQLSTDEAKRLRPAPEQKPAEAKKQEPPEAEQKRQEEDTKHIFSEGAAAYKAKDYAKALSLFEKAAEQTHDQEIQVKAMIILHEHF